MTDTHLKLRVVFGERGMLGPGKADLLELIRDTGSISAAGRAMGMSYKRAWLLVDTMNTMFSGPVVESSRGGATGGGARLTDLGAAVLDEYRSIQKRAATAVAANIAELEAMMTDISPRK